MQTPKCVHLCKILSSMNVDFGFLYKHATETSNLMYKEIFRMFYQFTLILLYRFHCICFPPFMFQKQKKRSEMKTKFHELMIV